MDTENNGGILQFIEDNPTLSIGGGIVVVLLIGAFLLRRNAASSSAASAAQDLSGLSTDANGNHVVYVPTQTSFTTINKTTTTNNPPPAQTTQKATAFVRAKYSNSSVKKWDDGHNGVPIRASASGSAAIVRLQPFGSQVVVVGDATSGASNISATIGSTQWLKLADGSGYISAFDVTGVTPLAAAGSGGRAAPVPALAHKAMRWTRPYTIMPGDSFAGIAQTVSLQARRAGAPQNTLVTAQMIQRFNNIAGPVTPGRSIILPQWG